MKKISVLLLVAMALCMLNFNLAVSARESPKTIYETDFEGLNISSSNTADSATGFVWVNRWEDAVSEKHNGSNMLKAPLYDSETYSTLGGLGIASRSNLALCDSGESYEVTLYMELHGLEYMFVEYVGGDDRWGSVIIYPNGTVTKNGSGDNICEVSYRNNILKFKFTMGEPFNDGGNIVNGYIKFTGYNCTNAYVYMDDISIVKSETAYSEDFSTHNVGVFDTRDYTYFGKFYSENTTEIVSSSGGDKYLKVSKMPNGTAGSEIFFLNRLSVLNRGRDYKVSMSLNTDNIKNLYIYNVGTWNDPLEYMKITMSDLSISTSGEAISNAVYKDGKLTFDFRASVDYTEYGQFEFVAEPIDSGKTMVINVDNIEFKQVPMVRSIEVESLASTFTWGEELDLQKFNVKVIYTDATEKKIDASFCDITGYDKTVNGRQVITFSYEGVSTSVIIDVVRNVESLVLDTSSVKKEYRYGENIDLSGLSAYAVYKNGEKASLENDPINGGYSISLGGFDGYTAGTYTVTVTYGNITKEFDVTVLPAESIDFSGIRYIPM